MSAATNTPTPTWFNAMAANYARRVGNSTRDLFVLSLPDIQKKDPITKSSIVHDNAAGPAVATLVLLETLDPADHPASVLISDTVPEMVASAEGLITSTDPAAVTRTTSTKLSTRQLDSQNFSAEGEGIPDNTFTHSILNFSIFNMKDPLACLAEMHRTLQPGGLAMVSTWKRFGSAPVVHAAQRAVRPDLPVMPVAGSEFLEEGYLKKMTIQAGFAEANVEETEPRTVVLTGENLKGLEDFMAGDMFKIARPGWTEEEDKKWPAALREAIEKEVEKEGGVRFESWVVLARK